MTSTDITASSSAPPSAGIDPITAAVIGGGLRSIAVEMGYRLARMAYSSIIRESEDSVDWLEAQLELIERIGIQNYQLSQMGEDEKG